MRYILLPVLIVSCGTAMAQELNQSAPLEFVRPSKEPVIFVDPPEPKREEPAPPTSAPAASVVEKRKVKRVVRRTVKKVEAPATTTTVEPVAPIAEAIPEKTVKVVTEKTTVEVAPKVAPVVVPEPKVTSGNSKPAPSNKNVEKKTSSASSAPVPKTSEEMNHATAAKVLGFRRSHWGHVRFANIWAKREGTSSGSFILGWDPIFLAWKRFNFGATIGATMFKSESVGGVSENFWAYEYGLSASYYVTRNFLPEIVVGGQMWNDRQINNSLLLSLNLHYVFTRKKFASIDRLYLGYGNLSVDGGDAQILRGGLGFRF